MPAKTDLPILTLRELNRALLGRQRLLTRQRIGPVEAIERLACLQGQWAPSPYVALWTRVAGFKREDSCRDRQGESSGDTSAPRFIGHAME